MLDIIVRPIKFGLDLMWRFFEYSPDGLSLWLGVFAIFVFYRFLLSPIFGAASDTVRDSWRNQLGYYNKFKNFNRNNKNG